MYTEDLRTVPLQLTHSDRINHELYSEPTFSSTPAVSVKTYLKGTTQSGFRFVPAASTKFNGLKM